MSDLSLSFLDHLARHRVPRSVSSITLHLQSAFPDVSIMTRYWDTVAFLPDGSIFYFSDYLEYNK